MQITRETDYAVRCVLYLSRKGSGITMVDEIAQEMSIPRSFLSKILQKLSKASLIKSYRGIKGGFELARSPELISLLDIVETIQGPVALNRCAVDPAACGFSTTCTVHPVWVELRSHVAGFLAGISFRHLAEKSSADKRTLITTQKVPSEPTLFSFQEGSDERLPL